ncbi:MAG: metallophosphoesterase family protein [Clostridia bacterium]|nr:metallophosphoesterase family protein [Clostridia bacterium]
MMPRILRILSLFLILSMLLPCAVSAAQEDVPAFTNIVLQLGADQSKLNFTWYSLDDGEGTITFAKAADLVDGAFPADATVVTAARTASVKKSYYANKATIEGLLPETEYVYQLTNGDNKSEIIPFTTGKSGDFSFAVVGDPQIGRGESGLDVDDASWERTLYQLVTAEEFAGTDFLVSTGDQVNQLLYDYDEHEAQFDAYSNHDELLSMPTVVTLGNHDNYDDSVYPYHFNEPNLDLSAGVTKDPKTGVVNSADYWFTYNSVLFLVLNNNDFLDYSGSDAARSADKAAAERHAAFIERVMEETKDMDIDWKIVIWHRSPYGSSYHNQYTLNADGVYNRTEQYNYVNIREYLVPVLYENGIDLVLSGHDHCYTRSHIIKPAKDENGNYIDASIITPFEDGSYTFADGTNEPKFRAWIDDTGVAHGKLKTRIKPVSVVNPDGILHVVAATASGSQVNAAQFPDKYSAVAVAANTRQMIRIDVTENSLTLVNYNLGTSDTDEIKEFDRFTIYHESPAPETPPADTDFVGTDTELVETVPPTCTEETAPTDTVDQGESSSFVTILLCVSAGAVFIIAAVIVLIRKKKA